MAANDRLNQPVQGSYQFKGRGTSTSSTRRTAAANVGFDQLKRTPGGQKIKPEQAVVLYTNWPFNPNTVGAVVHDANGKEVPPRPPAISATAPSSAATASAASASTSSPAGVPHAVWPVGRYTLTTSPRSPRISRA